jgi:formylglycine-generating enzyme required for sulfatase activity
MQLVAGAYCSEVRQTCLQSRYDVSNQKEICARFAAPSECTGARSQKRFCIDRYEWPNQAGERPEVMNNFYQAQVKCAALGKRLCTESEWTFACEGPEMKPYPYGYIRDPDKCNGDRPWDRPDMAKVARRDPAELARLWQGVRSGSQPECVSDFGVHDLPGNADEVAASENVSSGWRGKYASVTTGGPWYLGVRNQCRPKIYTHDEGFYYYYLSFRCCREADGRDTEPRTPKQIQASLSFDYVERLARFDTVAMREKLELKAAGNCSCPEHDSLCKTMCGSLLGPLATDAQPRPSPPR